MLQFKWRVPISGFLQVKQPSFWEAACVYVRAPTWLNYEGGVSLLAAVAAADADSQGPPVVLVGNLREEGKDCCDLLVRLTSPGVQSLRYSKG